MKKIILLRSITYEPGGPAGSLRDVRMQPGAKRDRPLQGGDVLPGTVYGSNASERQVLSTKGLKARPRVCMGVFADASRDSVSIAAIERVEVLKPERDPITWSFSVRSHFRVRCSETLKLSHPDQVKTYLNKVALRTLSMQVMMSGDADGSLAALFCRYGIDCRVLQTVITDDEKDLREGIPQRELLAALSAGVRKRLLIEGAGTREPLLNALRSMTLEGKADGLVLALCLAWWRASQMPTGCPRGPQPWCC